MLTVDFSEAPEEPIKRLLWLSGVKEAVADQLEAEYRRAYFNARLTGQLPAALDLRLHARKRVLAYTRAENERRGRTVARWGDGL
jgi:hypothetical protein